MDNKNTAGISGRTLAFKALLKVIGDNAYSNIAFDSAVSKSGASQKEIRLAAAVFYGVLERRLTLDFMLSSFSKTPLEGLDAEVLIILYIGAYQIVYMDRIPDSAAVNESVRLCKKRRLFSASGFVNGVLRSLSRNGAPKLPEDSIERLSVKYSFPKKIISLWKSAYGEEITEELLKAQLGRPPLCARVNTLKTTSDELIKRLSEKGISAKRSELLENALLMENTGSLSSLSEFRDGLFHVEDISSQLCCKALSPKKGEAVLDVCAAPGGKSVTMAELMENEGEILACDLYPQRLGLIEENAERAGADIIRTMAIDARSGDYGRKFDRVLCDVPCSGLGVIRRKPELRYKSDMGLDVLPDLQYLILCNASSFVSPGGTLVYSTCTLNPHENGELAERFLREHSGFKPLKTELGEIGRGMDEPSGQLTLFPHINGTDGFFISAFVRS